ncbi:hypothetical protein [Ammoniphilus sp. 3BR4]|uniref:hypothetical protein n=1 Tax=Ammoniphilus sp. 3BR4 TaxID=3158265 RepID=UPI0034670C0B
MSIRKEDLHKLVDLLDDKHNQPAYDLLRKLIKGDIVLIDGKVVEFDDAPMTEEEKKLTEKAMKDYDNGECIDWEEIKDEV